MFPLQIAECSIILNFDVSPATMTQRLLHRAQTSGRVDDNEETIKKRLDTFTKHSKPVIEHFSNKCKTVSRRTRCPLFKLAFLYEQSTLQHSVIIVAFLSVSIQRTLPCSFRISLIQRQDTLAEAKGLASRTTILKHCYQH